jgi:hypothetical protein
LEGALMIERMQELAEELSKVKEKLSEIRGYF